MAEPSFVVSCGGCRRVLNESCPDCGGPLKLVSPELAVCDHKTWPVLHPPAIQVTVDELLAVVDAAAALRLQPTADFDDLRAALAALGYEVGADAGVADTSG